MVAASSLKTLESFPERSLLRVAKCLETLTDEKTVATNGAQRTLGVERFNMCKRHSNHALVTIDTVILPKFRAHLQTKAVIGLPQFGITRL